MPPLLSAFLQTQRYKAVASYFRGDVLDLGCGPAQIVAWLQPGQRYVGVEVHAGIMDWLVKNRPGHEFHQRDLDTDKLSLGRQFDTILMIAVIEHLKKPDNILSQIPQHLRLGGKLLITTPSPLGDKIHKIGARLGLFSMEAVEGHEAIFTYNTLQMRLQQNGLGIVHYQSFLAGGNQLFVCRPLGTTAMS